MGLLTYPLPKYRTFPAPEPADPSATVVADLQEGLRRFFGPVIANLALPEGARGQRDPDAEAWR